MCSLFKKRKFITWLCLLLVFVQPLSLISNAVTTKAENANDRVNNYIKLAKGKATSDIDTKKITKEELQALGVFLSNFYVPMSTELCKSRNTKTAKDNMVKALVEGASFNETVAKTLVNAIWNMSLNTATELYIGVKKDGDKSISFMTEKKLDSVSWNIYREEKVHVHAPVYNFLNNNLVNKDKQLYATYTSFLDFFSGLNEETEDDRTARHSRIRSGNGVSFYLGWKDGNKFKPVFDSSMDSKKIPKFTASTIAYGMLNDDLNYNLGIGSALMDCTLEEFKSIDVKDRYKTLAPYAKLFVDCFGNIIVDYGVSKYVLVPACVNPYCWYTDKDKKTIGKNVNLVNLFMLQEAEDGYISGKFVTDKDSKNKDKDSKNKDSGDWQYDMNVYGGDKSLFNLYKWRVRRGDDDTSLDSSPLPWSKGKKETIYDAVKFFYTDISSRDNAQGFLNWYPYIEDASPSSTVSNGIKIKSNYKDVIDDLIFIDNLNSFKSSKDDYSVFNLLNKGKGGILQLDSKSKDKKSIKGKALTDSGGAKLSTMKDTNQINIVTNGNAQAYVTGIYISNALAFYNDFSKDKKGKNKYIVNYAYNKDGFPDANTEKINWEKINTEAAKDDDSLLKELQSLAYSFLNPSEGIALVAEWFKNKVTGILVRWHEDMAGASDGTSTTGSTKYIGFTGYVTLPDLSDMKWTANLLDLYNNLVVYLIIIMFVILLAYCIVGSMTFQRAIIGTVLFGVLAFLPPVCINATVGVINNTCDEIYGNKFTYWALVQNKTYAEDIEKAAKSSDKDNYLTTLFKNQANSSSDKVDNYRYARVKLKWTSPKKVNVTGDADSKLSSITKNPLLSSLAHNMVQKQLSGESFAENEDALYLYRDYADIYAYMTSAYNASWYNDNSVDAKLSVSEQDFQASDDANSQLKYGSSDTSGVDNTLFSVYSVKSMDNKYPYAQAFTEKAGFVINTGTKDIDNKHFTYLLDSRAGGDALTVNKELLNGDVSKGTMIDADALKTGGSNSHLFGFSLEDFHVTLPKINGGITTSGKGKKAKSVWSADRDKEFNKNDLGKFYFSLYSESPFYYFAWNILDQEKSEEFKPANLGKSADALNSVLVDMYTYNNQQYFYNYSADAMNGYGEMRDFCDMHSLFYYVIPYLRDMNKGVLKWSQLYGTYLYDDVKVRYDKGGGTPTNFPTSKDDSEYVYKWWHNYNVERLFNTYSSWVDLMYSCDYAKATNISVLGKKFFVTDPLDPTTYFNIDSSGEITEGRMMVFSRSEMKYYGLKMQDLTLVEQKIIKVQDQVYKDLLQLMDYGDFQNNVLVNAAGMLTTFAFNKEFSQITPVGTSYTLYPQSYELKAFSYDAYLRLILSETTGEDIMDSSNANVSGNDGQKSYYQRIVENSSITTGIALLILDVIAIYGIPALKIFFLLAIFFMSVLMIVASAIKAKDAGIKVAMTAWEALIIPLLQFSAISIGLAWIVSMFMSDGYTEVTGRGGNTISLGDPTMVVLVMIVVNLSALILYYKVCKKCLSRLISFAKAIGTSIVGAVGGAVGKIFRNLRGTANDDVSAGGTASSRGSRNSKRLGLGTGLSAGIGAGVATKKFLEKHVGLGGSGSSDGSGGSGGSDSSSRQQDANKDSNDEKSSESKSKLEKYNNKAKNAESRLNRDKNFADNMAERQKYNEDKKERYEQSIDSVNKQREALRKHSKNSGVFRKAGDFVLDKKLACRNLKYKVKRTVDVGVSNAVTGVEQGAHSLYKKGVNSRAGRLVRIDDEHRNGRLEAINSRYKLKSQEVEYNRQRRDMRTQYRANKKKKKGR